MPKRMRVFEGVLCCYSASVAAFGTAVVPPDQSVPVGEGICLSQVYTWLLTRRGPIVGTSSAAGADEPDRQRRRERENLHH